MVNVKWTAAIRAATIPTQRGNVTRKTAHVVSTTQPCANGGFLPSAYRTGRRVRTAGNSPWPARTGERVAQGRISSGIQIGHYYGNYFRLGMIQATRQVSNWAIRAKKAGLAREEIQLKAKDKRLVVGKDG